MSNLKVNIALKSEYMALAAETDRRLGEMEKLFSTLFSSEDELCDMLLSGGKRLRPILACAASYFGSKDCEIVPLMAMLEMMHTASLVHDDVVDDSHERRGRPTLNHLHGNAVAIKKGDRLLSGAMRVLSIYRGTGINEVLSETSREMCIGELDQLAARGNFEMHDAGSYMLRIKRKTALLLSASCRCGAIAAGLPVQWQDALADFGLNLGIAFQLEDDLLDFTGKAVFGKPSLQDLRRGIYTMPVIRAAQVSDRLPDLTDPEATAKWVKTTDGLEYTHNLADSYLQKGLDALAPLPEIPAKDALKDIALKLSGRER
ncbi:MAG: polyprenyl synthetase family protein [Oscillospiraceae bacterium]|nr:polyprenyl synthetase family protein [Oscillospiraceae bacterium]